VVVAQVLQVQLVLQEEAIQHFLQLLLREAERLMDVQVPYQLTNLVVQVPVVTQKALVREVQETLLQQIHLKETLVVMVLLQQAH
tara:strand:- start:245 stop:499 length:255 start_codon:yes stop_codon:yes gene_type:complete